MGSIPIVFSLIYPGSFSGRTDASEASHGSSILSPGTKGCGEPATSQEDIRTSCSGCPGVFGKPIVPNLHTETKHASDGYHVLNQRGRPNDIGKVVSDRERRHPGSIGKGRRYKSPPERRCLKARGSAIQSIHSMDLNESNGYPNPQRL